VFWWFKCSKVKFYHKFIVKFVNQVWTARPTYLTELEPLLKRHGDWLVREKTAAQLENFFSEAGEDDDWRSTFLPFDDKQAYAKRVYEAWVKHNSTKPTPIDTTLLGARSLLGSGYVWKDTDPKSRKQVWLNLIKGAIVEDQRAHTYRKPIVTQTLIGRFRREMELSLANYATGNVRDSKTVYEWSFPDGFIIENVENLPPLQEMSFSKRVLKANISERAATYRNDVIKIIRTIRSSAVASIKGKKNTKLEKYVYMATEDLVNVSVIIH
jgi:hypothetical protein